MHSALPVDRLEACASYNEVLALDATHEDAWCNLGAARLSEEDAEGAIEAFDRAIGLNDRIADAHWNRAFGASHPRSLR